MPDERLKLESPAANFKVRHDARPLIPEPPPVRIVAVEDIHVPAAAGLEVELDAFYIGLLKFERDVTIAPPSLIYRAENFRVWFDIKEPPVQRDDFCPLMVEVPALREIETQLVEREIEYERQKGLHPGQERLVLLDPAGNWVTIAEQREVR